MDSLGFVFPGQGSQSVGMLADVACDYPEIQAVFAEASDVLGYDLWQLVLNGPQEELDKTTRTQPALLAASYAVWRIITARKQGQPALLAGHSLGEYTALVCANAISFQDAVRLVALRGEYMQEAVPVGQGALAAIVGLEDSAVATLCNQAALQNEVLAPANYNCPGQVVIGGDIAAVQRAVILAKETGAKIAKLLPVSVPSHCALMKPAALKLAALLQTITIQKPLIPVVNNVDVAIYESAEQIRDGLVRQLYLPVRWVEVMQKFAALGIKHVVECGPGKVLSGLNKRIVPDMQLSSTADLSSLQLLEE